MWENLGKRLRKHNKVNVISHAKGSENSFQKVKKKDEGEG